MGEIGISRREFLYELQFWEVRRIIRGYRRRDRIKLQLLAECVYAATYAMRDPGGKTVGNIFPELFEDDDPQESPLEDEEVDEILQLIESVNQQNKQDAAQ